MRFPLYRSANPLATQTCLRAGLCNANKRNFVIHRKKKIFCFFFENSILSLFGAGDRDSEFHSRCTYTTYK